MDDQRAKGGEAEPAHFLTGGGAMGELMRTHDWRATPLGAPASWPQSLRAATSIMLNSRYPIALYWGDELALLYNDAWSPIPGNKHPWALGRPGREVWPEIWDTIGPLYDKVRTTGEGVWQEDELLPMLRHGYLEECYYNFTFSPVRGEDGTIDGIFNAVVETTDRVLSERRLRTLSRMGERANASLSVEQACRWATDILADNAPDVPFALVYLRDGETVRLVAAAGLAPGSAAAPEAFALSARRGPWPLRMAETETRAVVVPPAAGHGLSSAFWGEPVTEAVVAPIMTAGEARPTAFLVAGANPRRRVDASYRSFFELAAGHIGAALATARAYEDERRRAQALADLDLAKTTFFSNVSHEFRTPLTLMLGPLEDALAKAGAPDQRASLEVAHRNALRLLRLVNSLLDFSRLEAGRLAAAFEPTDLATLIADLASSFRSATDRAGLLLTVDTPSLPEPAYVDRDMWEKIVLNLVSNAFKFTHEGGIEVRLREAGGRAVLTVRDTGAGIPAEELPRLFDRFHRVAGAQGRSFEGSGIGLALAHELVKLHGGDISVESEVGRGATFTVSIPLGSAHLPAGQVQASAGHAQPTRAEAFVSEALRWLPDATPAEVLPDPTPRDPASTAGAALEPGAPAPRLVLADDNADLRDYIGRLLVEAGYRVTAVANGEAALAALRTERPDLLITDVMMPGLDGFGLLRAVRSDPALKDLAVVMLSARAGEEATIEGLDAGADDYLTKPFSARELLARVSTNIKLARIRREAAEAIGSTEAKLRENEERLRLATEHAEVGFWDVDEVNQVLHWPPLVKAMFGISADTAVSMQDFYDGLHPLDFEATSAAYAAAADPARRALYDVEYRTIGKEDGVVRWVGAKGRGVFDEQGRCLRVVGTAMDITLRKTREAELEALNETLERRVAVTLAERKILADIVEGTDAFVQVIDLDFRWLAINRASADEFERVFGVRPKAGDRMLDLLAHLPAEQEAVRAVWARALAGEEFTEIGAFGDPDRRRRHYEMKFNSLRNAAGERIGAYQFVYDVTDRIQEQERLARAEEQLRQAQKMEAMGQLTGGVAHDFNNLLTPIVGTLDILQTKGFGGEREQRLIAGAVQSAERARTLVQRLLAFARRQPLQATAVDIRRLVEGMGDLIASTTGPQIRVSVALAPDLPPARADGNQLEMALLNLAVNARDAMPDGGALSIGADAHDIGPGHRSKLPPGRYVRLTVADTGVGMDETVISRAIEPFFSTKGIGKGTGLGLSMAHGVASQLGGGLTIQSRPGQGAEIELWLPVSDGPVDAREDPVVEAAPGRGSGAALLVDDEELVRATTADMLANLGYAVVEAASAEEALELVRDGLRPAVLVTDHLMSGMSGADLARIVLSEAPGVRVLLVSGYAANEGIESDLPRLAKPFRTDELAAKLGALNQAN